MSNTKVAWLLATTNLAKKNELRSLLGDLPVTWQWLRDFPDRPHVDETGETFDDNAAIKARAYAAWSGMPALSDDGGLEIDALGGEPGVRSHRWGFGRELSDRELIDYTMDRMRGIPPDRRGARMRVVLALAYPDGRLFTAEGAVRGEIATEVSPHLEPGFPYRSIFYFPPYGKYFVDLTPGEHDAISHRRVAVERLIAQLGSIGEPPARSERQDDTPSSGGAARS